MKKNNMIAYTDGSNFYDKAVGWGFIIIHNKNIIQEACGIAPPEFNSSRNINGEINAVLAVLDWCKDNNIKKIKIVYDYIGIEKWITGEWRRKKKLTEQYYTKVKSSDIDISWEWVKGHSNNEYNDMADAMAKKGMLMAKESIGL